jgi:hypothetical protein
MAMYGVDCEESTLGQDVAKDSRSYFGHLLNQGLCWGGYRSGYWTNTGALPLFWSSAALCKKDHFEYFGTENVFIYLFIYYFLNVFDSRYLYKFLALLRLLYIISSPREY